MGTGAELIPVSLLASKLSEQLAKTALAAQDIRSEKSFKQLGNYLHSIQIYLLRIVDRGEHSPLLQTALEGLNVEVSKAEELVLRYKSRSLLSNIVHCRSICEALQNAIRDIGKALQLLELGAIDVNDSIRNAFAQLEHDMTQAEVRVSLEHLQILDMIKEASDRDGADRALINNVLNRIACALGLGDKSETFNVELSRFRKDIDEAKERKAQQEVQYMEQVMSLLSEETALEASKRKYKELKNEVDNPRHSFAINPPPSHIICHLSREIMENPVLLCTGHSYEKTAIQARFLEGIYTDPVSEKPLNDYTLWPNEVLARVSKEWKQKNLVARILKAKSILMENTEVNKADALNDLCSMCRENVVCKDWVVFEGLIPVILRVATTKRSRLRALCFYILQVIIPHRDHAKNALVVSGGLKQIVKNLGKGQTVASAAISLLLELMKHEDMLVQFRKEQGAILLLVTVLIGGHHEPFRNDIERMLDKLSVYQDCVQEMVNANWFKPLISHLQSASEDSRVNMATILADLELDYSRKEAVIEAHVIEPLVCILKLGYNEPQLASLKALHNLLSNKKAKVQLAELGAVSLVVECMKKSQVLRMAALDILVGLTTHTGSSLLISENGSLIDIRELVNSVVDILNFDSSGFRTHCLRVLWNLAMPPDAYDVCKIICYPESRIEVYSRFVKTGESPLCDTAMQLLFCLSAKDSESLSFLKDDDNFLRGLLHMLKSDSTETELALQTAAVGILSNLPLSANRLRKLQITQDVFSALLNMLTLNDLKAQENAIDFLSKFTDPTSIDFQRRLVQMDITEHLKHLLQSGTTISKTKSCNILRNFSSATPKLCSESPRRSLKLSRKSSVNCKVHQVKCNLRDAFCILEAGIVPDVIETLGEQNADLAFAAMEVLETILDENNLQQGVEVLDKLGAIELLFPYFLCHSCAGKCIYLLEIILKVPDMRAKYGSKARRMLSTVIATSTPLLKQKASQFYRQLT